MKASENDNENLRQDLKKYKNYQQLFNNFQNLQAEYDKQQDDIDEGKRRNKSLEQDLLKCGQELSNCKNQIAEQIEELSRVRIESQQKDARIETLQASKQDLEGKIIVLQQESKDDKKLALDEQNLQIEEYEKRIATQAQANDDLNHELSKANSLVQNLTEAAEKYWQLKEQHEKIEDGRRSLEAQFEQGQKKCENIENDKIKIEQELNSLQVKHSQMCLEHENIVVGLEKRIKLSENNAEECNKKFENYKTKVANVLKEGKLNSAEHDKEFDNLKFEIEKAHKQIEELQLKCAQTTTEVARQNDLNVELQQKVRLLECDLEQFENTKTRFVFNFE